MDSNNAISAISTILNLDNKTFSCYSFWCSILALKMLLMSTLTGIQRFRNKVFICEEDAAFNNVQPVHDHPAVERVRQAHRNDLENILPLFTIGFLYTCTNPSEAVACNLFRVSGVARILHTLVYAIRPVPQPSRVIAFVVSYGCTIYMAVIVALRTLNFI